MRSLKTLRKRLYLAQYLINPTIKENLFWALFERQNTMQVTISFQNASKSWVVNHTPRYVATGLEKRWFGLVFGPSYTHLDIKGLRIVLRWMWEQHKRKKPASLRDHYVCYSWWFIGFWKKKIISLMQNSHQKKLVYKRLLKRVGRGGACYVKTF